MITKKRHRSGSVQSRVSKRSNRVQPERERNYSISVRSASRSRSASPSASRSASPSASRSRSPSVSVSRDRSLVSRRSVSGERRVELEAGEISELEIDRNLDNGPHNEKTDVGGDAIHVLEAICDVCDVDITARNIAATNDDTDRDGNKEEYAYSLDFDDLLFDDMDVSELYDM